MKLLLLLLPSFAFSQEIVATTEISKLVLKSCPVCNTAPFGSFYQTSARWDNTFYTNYHNCHVYYFNKQFDSAYWYAIKTVTYVSIEKNDTILHNLAIYLKARIFCNKHMYRQALHDFQTLLSGTKFEVNVTTTVWANIGAIYLDQQLYDSAITCFLKAIDNSSITDLYTLQDACINISSCYMLKGDLKHASIYFQKGVASSERSKDTTGLASLYINIANLYYNQYQENLALMYFKKGYNLALLTSNSKLKQEACFNLAVVYENREEYTASVKYRKEYEMWHDSTYNRDNIWNIAQQEKKLVEQEKEHQAQQMQQADKLHILEVSKKVLQRNAFLVSAIVFLLFALFVFYAYRQKAHQNKLIFAQREQLNQLNHTKDQLFSIVAHDLRSPVQTLKVVLSDLQNALAERDISRAESISGRIEKISNSTYSLLNNLLYWSLDQADKLSFIKDKLNMNRIVEQISYDYASIAAAKQVVLQNLVSPDIYCTGDINTIKIALRNIVDNAIKYSGTLSKIIVSAAVDSHFCTIIVRDFGPGIQDSVLKALLNATYTGINSNANAQGTGLGLWLVRSMTEKNGGRLHIEKLQDGTAVSIILPLTDPNE